MTFGVRHAISRDQITGLILAGGQGSRMGGVDKGLEPLLGRPLIEHAIERLRPQVGSLAISANRNFADYAGYGFPVFRDLDTAPMLRPDLADSSKPSSATVRTHAAPTGERGPLDAGGRSSRSVSPLRTDDTATFAGPLAGIAAGLASIQTDWMLVVPCDAPLLPDDLARRFIEALTITAADLALATTREADGTHQRHPVFALIPRRLAASAASALAAQARKLDAWYGRHSPVEVSFPRSRAFYNANTLRDLRELER